MKILHINYSDIEGGAAIAASRHNEAMRRVGIDSSMLVVSRKGKGGLYVKTVLKNKYALFFYSHIYLYLSLIFSKLYNPFAKFSFAFWGFRLHKLPLVKQADIIYLHWINGSMASVKEIECLLKMGKTVFWYMHDMYPLTGGCHYAFDCQKYKVECCNCPMVRRKFPFDAVKYQFRRKMKSWTKYSNLQVVAPSRWLGNCSRESTIFGGHKVTICPNVLDTDLFKPVDKFFARNLLNIHSDKKLILFGADSLKSDYKGWEYLRTALNLLDKDEYECMIFGSENENIENDIRIKAYFTGYLRDVYSLVLAYNAADVFVSPSLADNFPNVILEAMSCGTPCVGFNVGGIPDLICHRKTGYLSKYKNADDLVNGICYVLGEENSRLSVAARCWVVNNCAYNKVLEVHQELNRFMRHDENG